MRRGALLLIPFLVFGYGKAVLASSIPMVSTVGEARVVLEGNDRAATYKKAVREALLDAVRKEAALLVENPEDLASVEGEIEDRLKDFVVKYQILEVRFIQPQTPASEEGGVSGEGEPGDYGAWDVKVKAFIDSDLLQRTIMGGGPVEGG